MKSYGIQIDVGKLLHYSAFLKPQINNETLLMIIKSFSIYVKKLYMKMIDEAIYSRRYNGEWEPIDDENYLEFIGTTPSSHIMALMCDALEVREIKRHIVIRFDPSYMYPGSKLPLIRVLNAIDNGTSKFNARPILNRIVRELRTHLPTLWKMYLKKKGVA